MAEYEVVLSKVNCLLSVVWDVVVWMDDLRETHPEHIDERVYAALIDAVGELEELE